jgi:hypothetical protein|tara:strand:- start:22014 stop:22895 length:882 start_codon:yes stop_codon:yes gene_type:complete
MTIRISDIKSGGGFVPVGSPAQFDDRERLINDGGVLYLKTGEVETNFANYPNFPIKYYNTGNLFTPNVSETVQTITLGGGFLWAALSDNTLLNFNYDGTPAGANYALNISGTPTCMSYIGGYMYVQHSVTNRPIRKYDLSDGSEVASFDLGGADDLTDMTTDGTYLYMKKSGENFDFYKYTTTGTLLDTITSELDFTQFEWDSSVNGFLLFDTNSAFKYIDTTGQIIYKEDYAPWKPVPTSIIDFTKTPDESIVFVATGNDVHIYQRGVFGGYQPQSNSTNTIGGATVYWRIR